VWEKNFNANQTAPNSLLFFFNRSKARYRAPKSGPANTPHRLLNFFLHLLDHQTRRHNAPSGLLGFSVCARPNAGDSACVSASPLLSASHDILASEDNWKKKYVVQIMCNKKKSKNYHWIDVGDLYYQI
jgi:hypothetical protein